MKINIDDIVNIAKKAGEKILSHYEIDIDVITKEDDSPVTKADIDADKIIDEGLSKYALPIISEESEEEDIDLTKLNKFWVVDPLDGTKGFIEKNDQFAVMIGLVEEGKPILGVVHMPALKKTYFAQDGFGAFIIEKDQTSKVSVSKKTDVENYNYLVSQHHYKDKMKDLGDALGISNLIKIGSCGIKTCYVADGQAELFFNPSNRMGIWDMCGPEAILNESGGKVTDASGKPLDYISSYKLENGVVASNGYRHEYILNTLSNLD